MDGAQMVQLAVYDLSRGLAKSMASSLLGVEVEAIYHTGVRVFGFEYFFSSGIQKMLPEQVESQFGMVPMRIVPIGETEIPEEIVDSFIDENRSRFSEETYDLLRHNCNNFSDELVFFLTSMHIPQEILDLPQKLTSTPLGQQVMPLLESMGATKAIPLSTSNRDNNNINNNNNNNNNKLPSSSPSIPSHSPPQSSAQPADAGMDLSCMKLWRSSRVDIAMADLRQLCYNQPSNAVMEMVRLTLFLYEKTEKGQVSYGGLQKSLDLLVKYNDHHQHHHLGRGNAAGMEMTDIQESNQPVEAMEIENESDWVMPASILFRFLLILTPQLALAKSNDGEHAMLSNQLMTKMLVVLYQIVQQTMSMKPASSEEMHIDIDNDNDNDNDNEHKKNMGKEEELENYQIRVAATMAIAALLHDNPTVGIEANLKPLLEDSAFILSPPSSSSSSSSTLNEKKEKAEEEEEEGGVNLTNSNVLRAVIACSLAHMCIGVGVSGDGKDATDEAIALLNSLANDILEETSEEVLKQRICGLYLLVTRGSVMEKLMVESQGVGNGAQPNAGNCGGMWDQLVSLISQSEE